MGTVSCKASPVLPLVALKIMYQSGKMGGKKPNKQTKQPKKKKKTKKNREGLISFMTRVMIGGCEADV